MRSRLTAVSYQLSALLLASTALAQSATTTSASTAIPAERFSPAVGPASLIGVEGAAVTPAGAVSWAGSVDWVHQPLTLRRAFSGSDVSRPVRDALVTDVALEFGLWKRIAAAVGVPVVLYQAGDRLRGTGLDETALATTVAGDFRVRVKAQLVGDVSRPGLHAAILLQVTAPTNGQHDFAAHDSATVEPRVVVDGQWGRLTAGVSVGARFANERTLFLTRLGDELTWAAGVGASVIERSRLGAGLVVEGAGAVGGSDGSRPVELRGAVRLRLGPVGVDAGAGAGLDRDAGAPAWRLFLVARSTIGLTK
ncbi:MAG: Myxococcales trans domain protein [Myxococcales bacterium]|nr:Myxococcales trans domain protein [Myxococcales bacterium]